jgi:hypothetical protein
LHCPPTHCPSSRTLDGDIIGHVMMLTRIEGRTGLWRWLRWHPAAVARHADRDRTGAPCARPGPPNGRMEIGLCLRPTRLLSPVRLHVQAADGARQPAAGPALDGPGTVQRARFLAGQALSTTRHALPRSTVSGAHEPNPSRSTRCGALQPHSPTKRRPAGRLIVYLVETRALPIRSPLPAWSDDRDIPAPSAGPHHWRRPPRLRARPAAAGEIVAVDIGHGNSGFGQQRAAFRQSMASSMVPTM